MANWPSTEKGPEMSGGSVSATRRLLFQPRLPECTLQLRTHQPLCIFIAIFLRTDPIIGSLFLKDQRIRHYFERQIAWEPRVLFATPSLPPVKLTRAMVSPSGGPAYQKISARDRGMNDGQSALMCFRHRIAVADHPNFSVMPRIYLFSDQRRTMRRLCAKALRRGAGWGLLGVLDGLTELLEQLVVVVGGQQVTRRDDHRDRPVDELECG